MGVVPIDWARLAAFLDGEGSIMISIQRRSKRWKPSRQPAMSLRIHVYNTDIRLINWLVETFGGQFEVNSNSTHVKRPVYKWRCLGKDRRFILEGCMPYFILKKQQAEIGLAFMDVKTTKRKQRNPETVATQEFLATSCNSLNLTRAKAVTLVA